VYCLRSLRILRLSEDTASTQSKVVIFAGGDVNVTLVTPGGSPRVLDVDSFLSTDITITNTSNGVIQNSTASRSNNTRGVELEDALVSFDKEDDRLLVDGSLEGIRVSGSDVNESRVKVLDGLSRVVLADSVLSSVRIVSLEFKTILLDVLQSLVGPASLATVVSLVTVNDLLFREVSEGMAGDLVKTFNGSNSGESPA